jgi:hypothetical protein
MEPVEKGVEKGVGKIQETFHHVSLKPGDQKKPDVEVEEHVTKNVVDGEPVAVDAEIEVEKKVQDNSGGCESVVVDADVEVQKTVQEKNDGGKSVVVDAEVEVERIEDSKR